VADNLDQKLERLVPLLKSRTGPAIVYVTLQKHAEEVAARLKCQGLEAMVYHAGLPNDQRQEVCHRPPGLNVLIRQYIGAGPVHAVGEGHCMCYHSFWNGY
jgi:hypothetical protein